MQRKRSGTNADEENLVSLGKIALEYPSSAMLLSLLSHDDVTTTGNSLKKAILELRSEGALIEKAIVVVDRGEGGQDSLGEIGVELISLVSSTDLLG